MEKINAKMKMLLLAGSLVAGSAQAATIGLTLSSDKDPLNVAIGDSITFTVGMTPSSAITGYTLDIRYDDAELDFDSSAQLVPFFGGAFVPDYNFDPATTASSDAGSSGLATSDSGRASILQTQDSENVGDLFSMTFKVLTPIADGIDDLLVGILDPRADDINPPIGGSPFTIDPDMVSAQIGSAVPVPAAVWLFGSGLMGLIGMARRKTA